MLTPTQQHVPRLLLTPTPGQAKAFASKHTGPSVNVSASIGSEDGDDSEVGAHTQVRPGRDAEKDALVLDYIEENIGRKIDEMALMRASRCLCPNPEDKITIRRLIDWIEDVEEEPSSFGAQTDGTTSPGSRRRTTHETIADTHHIQCVLLASDGHQVPIAAHMLQQQLCNVISGDAWELGVRKATTELSYNQAARFVRQGTGGGPDLQPELSEGPDLSQAFRRRTTSSNLGSDHQPDTSIDWNRTWRRQAAGDKESGSASRGSVARTLESSSADYPPNQQQEMRRTGSSGCGRLALFNGSQAAPTLCTNEVTFSTCEREEPDMCSLVHDDKQRQSPSRDSIHAVGQMDQNSDEDIRRDDRCGSAAKYVSPTHTFKHGISPQKSEVALASPTASLQGIGIGAPQVCHSPTLVDTVGRGKRISEVSQDDVDQERVLYVERDSGDLLAYRRKFSNLEAEVPLSNFKKSLALGSLGKHEVESMALSSFQGIAAPVISRGPGLSLKLDGLQARENMTPALASQGAVGDKTARRDPDTARNRDVMRSARMSRRFLLRQIRYSQVFHNVHQLDDLTDDWLPGSSDEDDYFDSEDDEFGQHLHINLEQVEEGDEDHCEHSPDARITGRHSAGEESLQSEASTGLIKVATDGLCTEEQQGSPRLLPAAATERCARLDSMDSARVSKSAIAACFTTRTVHGSDDQEADRKMGTDVTGGVRKLNISIPDQQGEFSTVSHSRAHSAAVTPGSLKHPDSAGSVRRSWTPAGFAAALASAGASIGLDISFEAHKVLQAESRPLRRARTRSSVHACRRSIVANGNADVHSEAQQAGVLPLRSSFVIGSIKNKLRRSSIFSPGVDSLPGAGLFEGFMRRTSSSGLASSLSEAGSMQFVSIEMGATLASTEYCVVRRGKLLLESGDIPVVIKMYHEARSKDGAAEVVALARLQSWPGCVRLLGVSRPPGSHCQQVQLLLQPCDENLAQWANRRREGCGQQDWVHEALSMFVQVCQLVSTLHDTYHMAHCDLKPQNVLLLDGRPLLADFSEARLPEPENNIMMRYRHLQQRNLYLWEARGTEAYACGEMHSASRRRPVDAQAADVWSLGCILYELVTGHMLFQGACSNLSPLMGAADKCWLTDGQRQQMATCAGQMYEPVRALIKDLCRPEDTRITAQQALGRAQTLTNV